MSEFTVSRRTTIAAPAEKVRPLIEDFHAWQSWSPWEGLDPNLERTYTGPDSGVGAHYAWKGNSKAGQGSMEITGITPERIDITLAFLKPWKATNQVHFEVTSEGQSTEVTWTMAGEHRGLGRLFALFMNMDKLVGKDFEKGLAGLKQQAEQR
ncbi:MAG: SRPBCC family protein [Nocardioidaceae bacterium]|nr:SRPBCC family protein [Nocardioidaceae bacterium]